MSNKEEIEKTDAVDDLINYLDAKSLKLFDGFGETNKLSDDINVLSTQNLNTSFYLEKYSRLNYSISLALENSKIVLQNIESTIADNYRNNKHSNKGKLLEAKEIKDKVFMDEKYIKQLTRVKKLEAMVQVSEHMLSLVRFRNSQIANQIDILKMKNSYM